MRITRFIDDRGQRWEGVDQGDGTAEVLAVDVPAGRVAHTGDVRPIVDRLAPVTATNILCIGLNYAAHAAEGGRDVPEYPCVFMKPTGAIHHPGRPIRIPACCTHGPEVDFEAELAVVIGKRARDVNEAEALGHVLGYTCANDVSARWWQKRGGGGQWVRGKGFDTFCPLGPVLVTPDEIPDPQALRIRSVLNGQVMQDDTTANMIFPVARLIAHLSQDTTLFPGTVILTGTPRGVGVARDPQVFLQTGDEITISIGGIGELTNPMAGAAGAS